MLNSSLVPAAIEARLVSVGKLPFAFGTRFLVTLLLGLIWLVPACWAPKLIAAMFVWDAFAVAVFLFDLLRLPPPSQLEARRIWHSALSLARPATVEIELQNYGRTAIDAAIIDETPLALRTAPPELDMALAAAGSD